MKKFLSTLVFAALFVGCGVMPSLAGFNKPLTMDEARQRGLIVSPVKFGETTPTVSTPTDDAELPTSRSTTRSVVQPAVVNIPTGDTSAEVLSPMIQAIIDLAPTSIRFPKGMEAFIVKEYLPCGRNGLKKIVLAIRAASNISNTLSDDICIGRATAPDLEYDVDDIEDVREKSYARYIEYEYYVNRKNAAFPFTYWREDLDPDSIESLKNLAEVPGANILVESASTVKTSFRSIATLVDWTLGIWEDAEKAQEVYGGKDGFERYSPLAPEQWHSIWVTTPEAKRIDFGRQKGVEFDSVAAVNLTPSQLRNSTPSLVLIDSFLWENCSWNDFAWLQSMKAQITPENRNSSTLQEDLFDLAKAGRNCASGRAPKNSLISSLIYPEISTAEDYSEISTLPIQSPESGTKLLTQHINSRNNLLRMMSSVIDHEDSPHLSGAIESRYTIGTKAIEDRLKAQIVAAASLNKGGQKASIKWIFSSEEQANAVRSFLFELTDSGTRLENIIRNAGVSPDKFTPYQFSIESESYPR